MPELNDRGRDFMRVSKSENAAMVRAEVAYTQALWYAWGWIDSKALPTDVKAKIEAFEFAERVKSLQLNYELGRTNHLESIQGLWQNFVAEKTQGMYPYPDRPTT